ncbi:MAG: thermonuclease family protein [Clostridia bacterium]|nr:thermonuclease family protein [Clostridia bacterium]
MKKIIIIGLILFIFLFCTGCINQLLEDGPLINDQNTITGNTIQKAVIRKVIDGDTIVAEIDDKKYKIRMIGVDTPECFGEYKNKPQPYSVEASKFTKEILTLGKMVYLESDVSNEDRYGRLLRYVWLDNPSEMDKFEISKKMFNAILINKGMATTMAIPPNVKYLKTFIELESIAREKKIGLWKD